MDGVSILASMLAGIVLVPLLQLVKKLTNLSGVPMAWVSYICSFALAIGVCLLTGAIKPQQLQPEIIFAQSGIVFSVATLVYRTLKEKLNLPEPPK